MTFLVLWKPAQDADSLTPPPAGLMAEMGQMTQSMMQRGALLDTNIPKPDTLHLTPNT